MASPLFCYDCGTYHDPGECPDAPKGRKVENVGPTLFDDPDAEVPAAGYARRSVDEDAPMVGRSHPGTAQAMQAKALPRSGTFRREVFDLISSRKGTPLLGYTDDELEIALGRSHQSTSGARSTLKADGHVRASGATRINRFGNDAIVWVVARWEDADA